MDQSKNLCFSSFYQVLRLKFFISLHLFLLSVVVWQAIPTPHLLKQTQRFLPGNGILSRLSSIFLGFAPPFLLLSIGALAVVLLAWILFENASHHSSKVKDSSLSEKKTEEHVTIGSDERYLQLSDVRIPLSFMVLFNVALFGTGNFASIASFEITSVYRFITIFRPFLMAALLIFKLFIPFMLVM